MPQLSVMFKTVSSDCNLDCAYCYYRESREGVRARRRIDDTLLEQFIPRYMDYVADVKLASMAWQGGEPTLSGLPFFEKVVTLQARHAHTGTAISNSLQTNGVLLDDNWGAFLKRYNWLVGVSLDGPEAIHDAVRTDRGGRGSFSRVMRGIDTLRRHAVDFNILCVVGPHNVGQPRELLRFFRQERFTHVQFIPAMDFQALEPCKPAAYLVTPEQYGAFLVEAFDSWYRDGAPDISVRTFDNFLQGHAGLPAEACVHSQHCDSGITVEHDGSTYPCDFYIDPEWYLGNVVTEPLAAIAAGARKQSFVARKQNLPASCPECRWLPICHGGCARNWMEGAEGAGADYFCDSYRLLFERADPGLRELATAVRNMWKYLEAAQTDPRRVAATGRNDPCPCGSGRKHKQCCGSPVRTASYVFRQ